MEYRIEAPIILDYSYLTQLILAWYQGPPARPIGSAAVFRPHHGQVFGQATSQRFGQFTAGPNIRQTASTQGLSVADRASQSFLRYGQSGDINGTTFPISTQPAATQSETNFAIGPNVRLRKMSALGDFNIDYFFWQDIHVLVLERLSGRHSWVKLKEGWNHPHVADPAPVSLGRFDRNHPMGVSVGEMTDAEKLAEVTRRAMPKIIDRGGEAIREQVESLLDPKTIATMLAIAGVSVVFPLVGLGFALAGVFFLGEDAVKVLESLIEFVQKTTNATTDAELDEAAEALVIVVVVGGVVLWELLSKKKGKGRKLVKKQDGGGGGQTSPTAKGAEVEPVKPKDPKKAEIEEKKRRRKATRLPKFKMRPPFKRNPKHSQDEFDRQVKGQEDGLNELTVEEYLKNRDEYLKRKDQTGDGRDAKSKKIQDEARRDALDDKQAEFEEAGMSSRQAELEAEKWLKTQNALHDPDQIAGGHPDKISGMGDAGVNKSLGGQWRNGRADALDEYVRKQAENMTPEERKTTKLNIDLSEL